MDGVLSWGRWVPPCLWQEQEKEGISGLGHLLVDPIQPLSFKTNCGPLEQQPSGESSGQHFGKESRKQTTGLLCPLHWGLSIWRADAHV